MLLSPIASIRSASATARYEALSDAAPFVARYFKVQPQELLLLLGCADALGAVVLGATLFVAPELSDAATYRPLWVSIAAFLVAWAFSALWQDLYGRFTLSTSFRRVLARAVTTCAMAFGILLFLGFTFDVLGQVSRAWLLTWAAAVFLWVGVVRLLWRAYLARVIAGGGCLERAVVFAESQQAAWRIAQSLERESGGHLRVAVAVPLPGLAGAPSLGWVEDAVREGNVDRIIIGRFSGAMRQANMLLGRLAHMTVDVTLLPELDGLQAPLLHVDRIGMLPTVDLDYRPLTHVQAWSKRAEDLVIAGLLTILVAPLLLVVSIAIKLDSPGPVFFRQPRAGFNGRTFTVWKFRTMYAHARDDLAVRQTSRGDKRVTRIGRLLRRTSIDELPQLFNVIAGDMSIVGPRPHALGMTTVGLPLHEAIEDYAARHRLKPGITGWAQINGSRGEVDTLEKLQRRVALDCYYIERWSLVFDLWIIVRTAAMMLFDRDAY
jgi:polysaccharide biosynthesis protein PslA